MIDTTSAPAAVPVAPDSPITENLPARQEPTAAVLPAARPVMTGVMATDESFASDDKRGKEGITSDDLRLPFLAIAQKTSKAIDPTEGTFIEGLKFLDLYNTETKENLGAGPIAFLPLMHRKRAHLRGENGLLEREPLAWDDPRVTWDGARAQGLEKPEGVRIYDWVVLLLPSYTVVVVSFMSKGFSAGQALTSFVQMRPGPAFGGKYLLTVAKDKNESGSFGKFLVTPAGKPDPNDAEFASQIYESIKGKTLVVDADADVHGEEGERNVGQGSTEGAGAPVDPDKVPF